MNDFESSTIEMPTWLHVTYAKDFPASWGEISQAFLKTVELLLLSKPPADAFVHFSDFGGRLSIDVNARPQLTKKYAILISRAEFAFQRIAKSLMSADVLSEFDDYICASQSDNSETLNGDFVCDSDPIQDQCKSQNNELLNRNDRSVIIFPNIASILKNDNTGSFRDSDVRTRFKNVMSELCKSGATRPFRLPVFDWELRLKLLAINYPNFERVIATVVRPHCALINAGVNHRMPPIFLQSSPGSGKNAFCKALTAVLNVPTPLHVVMAAESTSMSLGGSSNFFSNSAPGLLMERLSQPHYGLPPVANPLVIIDEVDKAKGRDFDPLASLYTLLEEDTAEQFEDQSLPGIRIDASYVRFILLGNEISIPEPLLSRVLTFNIELPSPSELRNVANRILESQVQMLGIEFSPVLPETVLDEVEGLSLRQCKVRIQSAIGIAIADGKRSIDRHSWSITQGNIKCVRKMGFN
jgi:ATP-dependent Lon protease